MRGNRKTHTPSGFRGRRIQPLCDASPAQHTYVNQGSAVSSSLAHNAQDRARAHEPERNHNDHDSEGNWHGLPDMMRKTLMVSENKEKDTAPERSTLIPFGDVDGCLVVDIKVCRHFLPMIYLKYHTNLYIRISINNLVKYTKSFSLLSGNDEKKLVIEVDEMKFFSIQVPRRQDDKRNNISLGLVQCSDTENCLLCLGSIEVHLYEIIQKTRFTEELEILNENTCVCSLLVEFMFVHGAFGYGFSQQLKPLQRNIEPTMFLNVASHPKRKHLPKNQQPLEKSEITPQPVPVESSADGQHPNQQPIVQLGNTRERLERMEKEYRNLSTWKENPDYLESILTAELEHTNSKEMNINKIPESLSNNQYEKRSEDIITLDVPRRSNEGEITPEEIPEITNKANFDLFVKNIIPYCYTPQDDKDYLNSSAFPFCQVNTLTHVNVKTKKQATFDQRFQSLKENNNNVNHLVTFMQYQKDIQTLYMSQNENCTKFPESQSFKNNEDERNSQPFFFPEVLKTENIKLKVHKERKYTDESKKLSNNIERLLPTARPTASTQTLLHWTARTTIHDCSDKYEDDYVTPVKHPTKTKSRARLGGKNSDDSQNQGKHAARHYTAPEPNKQQESYTRKFPSP